MKEKIAALEKEIQEALEFAADPGKNGAYPFRKTAVGAFPQGGRFE